MISFAELLKVIQNNEDTKKGEESVNLDPVLQKANRDFYLQCTKLLNCIYPIKRFSTDLPEHKLLQNLCEGSADKNVLLKESVSFKEAAMLSPEIAASIYANIVNIWVSAIIDDIITTIKSPDTVTIDKTKNLLRFMEGASEGFEHIAPNVTDISPVIYEGKIPMRKLEMIYTKFAQHARFDPQIGYVVPIFFYFPHSPNFSPIGIA